MKVTKLLLLSILLLASGCILNGGEQQLSISEFKTELKNSTSIAIVMDTRNSSSTNIVMQCGADLAMTLGSIGRYGALKNQTFAYEGEKCFYSNVTSSINECESRISGSLIFYVRYNAAKNSTSLYKSKAIIEGDGSFLADCAIARMIK